MSLRPIDSGDVQREQPRVPMATPPLSSGRKVLDSPQRPTKGSAGELWNAEASLLTQKTSLSRECPAPQPSQAFSLPGCFPEPSTGADIQSGP